MAKQHPSWRFGTRVLLIPVSSSEWIRCRLRWRGPKRWKWDRHVEEQSVKHAVKWDDVKKARKYASRHNHVTSLTWATRTHVRVRSAIKCGTQTRQKNVRATFCLHSASIVAMNIRLSLGSAVCCVVSTHPCSSFLYFCPQFAHRVPVMVWVAFLLGALSSTYCQVKSFSGTTPRRNTYAESRCAAVPFVQLDHPRYKVVQTPPTCNIMSAFVCCWVDNTPRHMKAVCAQESCVTANIVQKKKLMMVTHVVQTKRNTVELYSELYFFETHWSFHFLSRPWSHRWITI